jgi:hypothetical protein
MPNKNFTNFTSKPSLQSGDFLIGYKQDGTAEFKITFDTLVDSLKSYFSVLPPPTIVEILTDGSIWNVDSTKQYYFKVDDSINFFELTVDGINKAVFTNVFDVTNYNNCKLTIATTPLISSSVSQLFVTNSCTLSTYQGNLFTFYYFTTGSLILGFSPKTSSMNALTSLPNSQYKAPAIWNDAGYWNDLKYWKE